MPKNDKTSIIEQIDINNVVEALTTRFAHWFENSEERMARGLTDDELKEQLALFMGTERIAGSSDLYGYHYHRSGFRVWISKEITGMSGKPTISEQRFFEIVRSIYEVRDPNDQQIALF